MRIANFGPIPATQTGKVDEEFMFDTSKKRYGIGIRG